MKNLKKFKLAIFVRDQEYYDTLNSEISDYEIDDNFFQLDYKIFDTKNRLYYLDKVIENLKF